MQVASMLSDLSSLQACDPNSALALVSARPGQEERSSHASTTNGDAKDDADLKRAKELLELHAHVKLAHENGSDKALNDARQQVERVVQTI